MTYWPSAPVVTGSPTVSPLKLTLISIPARGRPLIASVTTPAIEPAGPSEKSMPLVTPPVVTAIGVPVLPAHNTQRVPL